MPVASWRSMIPYSLPSTSPFGHIGLVLRSPQVSQQLPKLAPATAMRHEGESRAAARKKTEGYRMVAPVREKLASSFSISLSFPRNSPAPTLRILDLCFHWKFISSVGSHGQSSFPFNPKMPTARSSLPIIKVKIRKIARRRKLTRPGKGKPKWQLTALLWLSVPVYVDGWDGDFSFVDPRSDNVRASQNNKLSSHINCVESSR